MPTSLPETAFRHLIASCDLRLHWLMSWHEDREITPGMPDLHYVMKGEPDERFRVGWLELKAINTRLSKTNRIGVKPSQHQYNRAWARHMPIHFLVRVQDRVYLIPGAFSKELATAFCEADLGALCITNFHKSDLVEKLPQFLRDITKI